MVIYISRNVIGVFAVDGEGTPCGHVPFAGGPDGVAQRLHRISAGELVEEERSLLDTLAARSEEIVFDSRKEGFSDKALNPATRYLQRHEADVAREAGATDLVALKNAVALSLVRFGMHEGVGRDRIVVNAVEALDVIDRSLNLLSERLREWYGLHFPELDQEVPDHERFVSLVLAGRREQAAQSSGDATIIEYSGRSLGIELADADVATLTGFASALRELYSQREAIAASIESLMDELAPNLKTVAGANLGARMLSLAGTLEHLARMPSSTVQILGAERALFKHLVKGSPSPKHGIIFQHPAVSRAPGAVRGKVARALAAKISLAARVDFYSHADRRVELKEALDAKVARIQAQGGGA